MSSVDSRIVTMKFDNTQFKRGATETLSMMEKLKSSMNFSGMGKGLSGISGMLSRGFNAINPFSKTRADLQGLQGDVSKFSMAPMDVQVSGISKSFMAMSAVAITAISNVTNKAINAGTQLANSLTFEPIMSGLREYETNLNSIQTVLANTGLEGQAGLDKVNGALQELNTYSDQTIYNFSEMARNIGTFTAAGVDLNTSTAAIKGIANLAAVSGSNSQQASTAMYQLSQALAAGKVSLMDWNSVVNAGMGGKVFQEALMDTARVQGVAVDDMVKSAGSFRNSLTENGWLTTDVLTDTLKKFTGDLSRAQLAQMGYQKEQIDEIIKMGKTATDAATKVKTMSQLIGTLQESAGSGWARTWMLVFGDFNEAKKLFTGMNVVLGGMISRSADARNKVLGHWNKLGGRNVLIEGLANAFKALMNILKPIHNAFRDVFPRTTGRQLFELTKAFRDFTEGLILSRENMKNLRSIFGAVFGVIGIGVEVIKGIVRYFFSLFDLVNGGAGGFLDLAASVAEIVEAFTQWVLQGNFIARFFDHVIAGRAALFEPIIDKVGELLSILADLVRSGASRAFDWIQSLAPYAEMIAALASSFAQMAQSRIGDFLQSLEPYADHIRDLASSFAELAQSRAGEFISNISDRFNEMKPTVAELKAMIEDFKDSFANGFDAIGPMLSSVGDSLSGAFGGIKGAAGGMNLGSIFEMGDKTSVAEAGIKGVGGALVGTAKIADEVRSNWDRVVDAFKAVGEFLAPVGQVIQDAFGSLRDKIMDFVSGLGLNEGLALVNTGFFIAMYVMFRRFIDSMKSVADAFAGTLDSVSGVLDQVTSNLATMQQDVKANIIMKIAAALVLLAVALLILSRIDAAALGKSLAAVAALLFMLSKAMGSLETAISGSDLKDTAKMAAMSAALVALGIAILALSVAVAILGRMDTGQLVKGLSAVAVILAVVVGAAAILEKTGGAGSILIASAAILVLSAALIAFSGALKLYASLDTGMMLEGGLKVAAAITAIGLSMQFMPKNVLASAAALLIISAALIILAGSLKLMGSLSGEEMAKSLIMLGGSLIIISLAMLAMSGAIGGAAAITLFAVALAILVPSLVILSQFSLAEVGIALLALAGVFVVLGLAGLILTPVVPVILALAHAIMILGVGVFAIGAGLLLFSAGLAALAITGTAGIAVLTAAIIGIAELFPLIMQQIGLGIIAFAKVISEAGPPLVRAFTTVLMSLIQSIIRVTPAFGRMLSVMLSTGLRVLRGFFPDLIATGYQLILSLLRAAEKYVPRIVPIAVSIAVKFMNTLGSQAGRLADAGAKMIIKFINGVADAIRNNEDDMRTAGGNLASAIISGMASGISNGLSIVTTAASNLASRALDAAKSKLGIKSPSKEFFKVGVWSDEGLAGGLSSHARVVEAAAEGVGRTALDTLTATMSKVSDAVSTDVDMSPVISPVLDLAQLAKDATQIGGMLGSKPLSADVSYQQASSISADRQRASETVDPASNEPRQIVFQQTNNSPKPIDTVKLYRNTNSLISFAKEKLES